MAIVSTIKIVNWNCNGLRFKIAELIHFADQNNVHALVITETRLNSEIKIVLPGYKIYRADGQSSQRGVLLAIKNELNSHQVPIDNLDNMEAIAASVSTESGQVIIAAVYNSPSRLKPLLNNDVQRIFRLGTRVIALGDYNARHNSWNCSTSNKNGRFLWSYCLSHNIEIVFPDEPTHLPACGAAALSTLDILLAKGLQSANFEAVTYHALSSDHNPVISSIALKVTYPRQTQWDLKSANWNDFRKHLCESIEIPNQITSTYHLENIVRDFSNQIISAAKASIPQISKNIRPDRLPDEIKALIHRKNFFRRCWIRNRSLAAKREYNSLNAQVRSAVAKWRQMLWINRIKNLSTKEGSIWKFVKKLQRKKVTVGAMLDGSELTYVPRRQAEILADNYERQFTNLKPHPNEEEFRKLINEIAPPYNPPETPTLSAVKPGHIRAAIKKIKLGKAPGYDGILPIFVRFLPGKAWILLARIINSIFSLRYFPTYWKKAVIIPILKPGKDPKLAVNYRPISLLPILAKLAERFVLDWLEKEVNIRKLLPSWQFGFRKNHSAVHQVARVVNYATTKGRWPVALVLLDVAKAFDSVWHSGLIAKLERYGINGQLADIIKSFLEGRQFRVRVGLDDSHWRIIKAGTPQGALLSPLLYTLYTADINKAKYSHIAQFADDTALFYSHRDYRCVVKRIENDLKEMNRYFENWRLSLNKDKTEAVMLSSRKRHLRNLIKFDSSHLNWSNSARYLGVYLDRRLKFGPHIRKMAANGKIAARLLWPLIKPGSQLNVDEKLNLYKAMVRPCLTYGVPVWWGRAAKSNVNLLERVENKTLRIIADPPPGINNVLIKYALEIDPLRKFLEVSANRFDAKLSSHPNELINTLQLRS